MQNPGHDLGAALRDARLAKGLTLEVLAASVGLSAAFLSRLERGQASTSISNLIRVAGALELPVQRLFPVGERAGGHAGYVLRRGKDSGVIVSDAYRYKPLAGGLPHQAISVFELEYAPGKGAELGEYEHAGEEVVYVLEGSIEFRVAGARLQLEAGDALQFDARQPHLARNTGKSAARLLMIVAGHGDGERVTPSLARTRIPRKEKP